MNVSANNNHTSVEPGPLPYSEYIFAVSVEMYVTLDVGGTLDHHNDSDASIDSSPEDLSGGGWKGRRRGRRRMVVSSGLLWSHCTHDVKRSNYSLLIYKY